MCKKITFLKMVSNRAFLRVVIAGVCLVGIIFFIEKQKAFFAKNFSNLYNSISLKSGPNSDLSKSGTVIYEEVSHKCSKGDIGFSHQFLLNQLPLFGTIYSKRPKNNYFGTGLHHQFALWTLIRFLKPRHIVESGINYGLGTWMLRQAAPDAQLILLDPKEARNLTMPGFGNNYFHAPLIYHDPKPDSLYMIGKEFQDFAEVGWDKLGIDKSSTLVFFDDHQSHLKRIFEALHLGFIHLMFDDGWAMNSGDCLSMKQVCDIYMNKAPPNMLIKDDWNYVVYKKTIIEDFLANVTFDSLLDVYYEFSPIFYTKEHQPGWGTPLLNTRSETEAYNIINLTGVKPNKQNMAHINICYVKLKLSDRS